jgi:tetratricopeptide (TPR) repeat protein
LFVIAVSGAFGGFVDGMRATRSYKVRFGSYSADWGSVADALVGTAASVAIFAFAESIFGGGKALDDKVSAWLLVKIAAWGVLSGYAGTKLLDDLSSKAVRQLIKDETSRQVGEQIAGDSQAQEIVQEAEQLRQQHLARVAAQLMDSQTLQLLERAILKLRGVLKQDAQHRGARNGLANALADLGVYCKAKPEQDMQTKAAASFKEAIELQDGIIRQDPKAAKAYYNRACYKAVAARSDDDKLQAIGDLKLAFERDDNWRVYAQTDPDLVALQTMPFWRQEIDVKAAGTGT